CELYTVLVRLIENEPETPTTRRIRLMLEGRPFQYRAGQAASLAAEGDPTPYSIASAPSETSRSGVLEFLIKVGGANGFGAVVDRLRPGVSITVDGPVGTFTLDGVPDGVSLLFIAGGTGIAPIRSMIREAIDTERPGALSLVYSSRTSG